MGRTCDGVAFALTALVLAAHGPPAFAAPVEIAEAVRALAALR